MNAGMSRNRLFAAAALLLGILAIFGSPYPIDADLEPLGQDDIAWVQSLDLARDLVEGRTDLRILDLRSPDAYAEYHLPRAENVQVAGLKDYALEPWQSVVLYGSDSDVGLASAVLLERGMVGSRSLLGGMEAWQTEILRPELAEDASPDQVADFRVLRGISLQLGGEPVGGDDLLADVASKPRPKLELPSAASMPSGRKKKASEGC